MRPRTAPPESSAPTPARLKAAPSRSSRRAGRAAGRGEPPPGFDPFRRADTSRKSMPSRLTPRSRNGITAGRQIAAAGETAGGDARAVFELGQDRRQGRAADRVDRAGPTLAVERPGDGFASSAARSMQLGGAEPSSDSRAVPAGRSRRRRDGRARPTAALATLPTPPAAPVTSTSPAPADETVTLEGDDRQHRGEPGGADRHRLRRTEAGGPMHQHAALTRAFSA